MDELQARTAHWKAQLRQSVRNADTEGPVAIGEAWEALKKFDLVHAWEWIKLILQWRDIRAKAITELRRLGELEKKLSELED